MATIEQINAEKQAAVDLLDKKILEAGGARNAPGLSDAKISQLDNVIDDLMAHRDAVFQQAYERAAGSEEMKIALAALKAATAEMNTVAAQMTTAAEFIAKTASL